ncbi:MAG: YbgF trimerization domain-containing protein, partial [Nitrosomonadales bacterium]|nr:YbgF trimerization domain-containing protein [Nitrosomonadales bacterium]
MMRHLLLGSVLLLALSQNAHAFLEDKEARKKITENQTQNQATFDELKKNQQALEERLAAIEAVIKGQGLLDLLGQVEQLNQELSRVKGELEVA